MTKQMVKIDFVVLIVAQIQNNYSHQYFQIQGMGQVQESVWIIQIIVKDGLKIIQKAVKLVTLDILLWERLATNPVGDVEMR